MRPKVAAESCSLPELVPKKKQIHPPPLEVDPRARAAFHRLSRKPAPQQRVPVTPAARPADGCCCDPPSGDAPAFGASELPEAAHQVRMLAKLL
ncbi:hypothetical protein DIPPA_35967 [Diplonema papillatum]|nr:hypothetical protein DIPPA_35967 [Diplonema papillatum]